MEPEEAGTGLNVDLTSESSKEEVNITLTRAQLHLIYEYLAQNIQPRGYEMIAFAYDLFNRLNAALEASSDDSDVPIIEEIAFKMIRKQSFPNLLDRKKLHALMRDLKHLLKYDNSREEM